MIPMHSIFPRGNQSFALGGILDKKRAYLCGAAEWYEV